MTNSKVVQIDMNNRSRALIVKEHSGQRVLTFKDIDELHDRVEGTASRNFRENRLHFVEGEDFYYLTGDDLKKFATTNFVGTKVRELVLLTECGYLMAVKSLKDELAWKVQRSLVNNYFKFQDVSKKEMKLPTKPMDALRLMFKAAEETQEQVDQLDSRVIELEDNASLSPGDYNYISRLVNRQVASIISSRHLNPNKEQRTQLYKDLNSEVAKISGVRTRSQLRQRHFDLVVDFIVNWQPSTATMTLINQMDNEG